MKSRLVVECCGGSSASASYFLDGKLDCRCDAFIGRNGLGKEREGDARTPSGVFGIRRAFGIRENPGTALEYKRVCCGTVACDEEGPYYNTIVDDASRSGERMWEYVPEYDYGLELDFNPGNVYPLGSAIFVHCKGGKSWTGGCVALDEPVMERILRTAGPDMEVEIKSSKDIL